MSYRYWTEYVKPNTHGHMNGRDVLGNVDSVLVNDIVANYAQARRNVLCIPMNCPSTVTPAPLASGQWTTVLDIPTSTRLRGNTLKFWMLSSASIEAVIQFNVCLSWGITSGSTASFRASHAGSPGWNSVEIDITDYLPKGVTELLGGRLQVTCQNTGFAGCTVTIYSMSAFCRGDEDNTYTFLDLTGAHNQTALEDGPDSALQRFTLLGNTDYIRNRRVPPTNVLNHWWRSFAKMGNYAANHDDLGRYKILKRQDVTSLDLFCLCETGLTTPVFTIRAELVGIGGSVQTNASVENVGGLKYFKLSWTGLNAAETEYELLIDAVEATSTNILYMPGVYLLETPGAAVVHTVPDVNDAVAGRTVKSSTWANCKATNQHLSTRGGMAYVLADWRFGTYASSYDGHFNANAAAMDKDDWGGQVADGGGGSVMARAPLFASTNSKRLRVVVGYATTQGEDYAKVFSIQISHSLTLASFDSCDPRYDITNAKHVFLFNVSDEEIESVELAIPSAAFEEYPGIGVPYQVWVMAMAENFSEYIEPKWITIEEIVLDGPDFP